MLAHYTGGAVVAACLHKKKLSLFIGSSRWEEDFSGHSMDEKIVLRFYYFSYA